MSQFFKALEQAERDRLRQDQAETTPAPQARTRAADARIPDVAASDAAVAEQPAADIPAAEKRTPKVDVPSAEAAKVAAATNEASKVAASRPLLAPAAPTPVFRRREASAERQAPSPISVFRESLRTSDRSKSARAVAASRPLLVVQTHPNSIEAEAYRTVRTNIELMSEGNGCRHIAITSAAGGDGKSTTAANLAVVAAQGGRRVCLVDADLRRPTVQDIFGLRNVDGLVTALEHGQPLHTVAQATDIEGLSVVATGRGADERFHDLLTSQRLESVLRQSEGVFDIVVFDSPPVTSVADALSIAAVCDGVILVVRAGSVPFSVLRRAIGQVTQVKGRVMGVLLNRVDLRATDSQSYGYFRGYQATLTKAKP
jgi:capsular exopolysaccharide synthesis family protein